ncbi:8e509a32-ae07-4601-bf3e-a9fec1d1f26e-CDS [Sclerotinia trifoliorum]|uniref:8e509a32-ae07-4601-bf3e-a9fec1d1f26e-CDS n=1 Tax=Sclerotinia trifoliorum TaxID=28548 RepID=A0A8H2W1R0_9HELO|nr:8e509a32-ae07-4601-bf3e-a9fec1d1f26e-CDS [Sclerotinia trifoliorum]
MTTTTTTPTNPNTPSTFPLFPNLVLELRRQIWLEALPTALLPSLYFYKKGCWQPRIFQETDPGYCDEVSETLSSEDLNRNFEFQFQHLDKINFQTSLMYVNHEARDIVFSWARTVGLEIERCGGGSSAPLLAVPFNPARDVLFVSVEQWDEFYSEPYDRSFEEDMIDLTHGTYSEITRLAVPEALFEKDINALEELSRYYSSIEVLYIIVDTPPELHSLDNGMHVQPRWGYRKFTNWAYVWNDEEQVFKASGERTPGFGFPEAMTLEVCERLGEEIISGSGSIREVQPVFAVKGSG